MISVSPELLATQLRAELGAIVHAIGAIIGVDIFARLGRVCAELANDLYSGDAVSYTHLTLPTTPYV